MNIVQGPAYMGFVFLPRETLLLRIRQGSSNTGNTWGTQGIQFFQIPQRLNTKHLSKYDRAVIACHY